MLILYRAFAMPLFTIALPFLSLFNEKVRRGVKLRLRRRQTPSFSARPIWIHASSGEFEYAKAVIRELKRREPGLPVVVTYFSPTYARQVETFPGVDHAEPLPLDLPGPCASFLNRVRPRACLIARTDFWPEMLAQTKRRGIPRVVFAYTQRPVSGVKAWVARQQLALVDQIYTVSETDLANVRALGISTPSECGGDPRYDQVDYRLAHPKPLPPKLKPERPTLVAGSTWDEDEAVLLPAVEALLKTGRLKLILVPHEPTPAHLDRLKRELTRLGLGFALYSEERAWRDEAVLLVDRTGVLAELYAWGEFAFVGGSFRRTVHSVMEALGTGAVTFVGPKHINNREATEFSQIQIAGEPGLTVVTDAAECARELTRRLDAGDDVRADFARALQTEFKRRLGAAVAIAERSPPA